MLSAIESALTDLSLSDIVPTDLKDAFVQAGLRVVRQEDTEQRSITNDGIYLSSYLDHLMRVFINRALRNNVFHVVKPRVVNSVIGVKEPITAGFLTILLQKKFLLRGLFKWIRAPPTLCLKDYISLHPLSVQVQNGHSA